MKFKGKISKFERVGKSGNPEILLELSELKDGSVVDINKELIINMEEAEEGEK